jgi:hypothetical protein
LCWYAGADLGNFAQEGVAIRQMKRYKYQATVTLSPRQAGQSATLPGPACRMVVRAAHRETHASRLFSALVTSGGDSLSQAAPSTGSQVMVTLVVLGDTAGDYLAPGEEFDLWRGRDVGHGMITRRIFV